MLEEFGEAISRYLHNLKKRNRVKFSDFFDEQLFGVMDYRKWMLAAIVKSDTVIDIMLFAFLKCEDCELSQSLFFQFKIELAYGVCYNCYSRGDSIHYLKVKY